ncbi:MAG: hypothetical protein QXQ02_10565 [Halobacteria archaeon]
MSSFGTLITAGIMAVMIMLVLAQGSYIIQAGIRTYNEGVEALRYSISLERTVLRILGITPQSGTTIHLEIKNVGSYSIPVAHFDRMEIFVVGTLENYTYPTVVRVPFDQLSIGKEGWRVVSVLTNGVMGEALNPINLPYTSKGKWDPSEELVIMVNLDREHALNLTYPINIIVVAPNGASTTDGGF